MSSHPDSILTNTEGLGFSFGDTAADIETSDLDAMSDASFFDRLGAGLQGAGDAQAEFQPFNPKFPLRSGGTGPIGPLAQVFAQIFAVLNNASNTTGQPAR